MRTVFLACGAAVLLLLGADPARAHPPAWGVYGTSYRSGHGMHYGNYPSYQGYSYNPWYQPYVYPPSSYGYRPSYYSTGYYSPYRSYAYPASYSPPYRWYAYPQPYYGYARGWRCGW